MSVSRHQSGGQNHNIKIANRVFENEVKLKYLEVTVTKQNLIDRMLISDQMSAILAIISLNLA
jgi:hypothetical protein